MIKVNKNILSHPDFIGNPADELCRMLESLMDEIFENDDDIDFDFIDECADAINVIRSGNTAQIIPVISRRDFLRKLNIKSSNKFGIVAAAAAATLILLAGTQIKTHENVSVIQALSGIVSELFQSEEKNTTITSQSESTTIIKDLPTEKTSEETTLKEKSTKKNAAPEQISIKGISIETTPEFRKEYYVGERFSNKGIMVFAEYSNGERKLIQQKGYIVEVSKEFATKAKYETISIRANGFTEKLTVRVIENTSTKKLNSIYAVFPDNFDFTSEDLENFKCDKMQVYALYSDGSEEKLKSDEYTISYEHSKTIFKEKIIVTVEYENCFCKFAVSEK